MSRKAKQAGNPDRTDDYSKLREEAERFLNDNSLVNTSEYTKEIKNLFQELQVHQIELEMQNDELRLTNVELERERGKFSGMFNLAPVGYFILDHTGVIKDVNDTGMSLLGNSKANIVRMRLQTFITRNNF